MASKRAGEAAEGQPPCKKKPVGSRAAASGAPPVVQAPVSAASGAPPLAQAPAVPPLCIAQLLETEGALLQKDQLAEWVRAAKAYVDRALHSFLRERETEMSFTLPPACSMILPLAIDEQQAASGADLSAFREAMHYDNMMTSFRRAEQYEAAGTVWMLDPICSDVDKVSLRELESAMGMWSEDRASSQRLSFDVPLPAKAVVDANKAPQRVEAGKPGVCVAEPFLMLAGRAVVVTWYAAMSEALQQRNNRLVWHLFNAALSVPIRVRLMMPDGDASHLAALKFSEEAALFASAVASATGSFWRFAGNACRLRGVAQRLAKKRAVAKLNDVIEKYGLTFKSQAINASSAYALKGVHPFVMDDACCSSFALAEVYCPELCETTALLMAICKACSKRNAVCDAAKAREDFVFVLNCLRVARLTGDIPKDDKISVSKAIGGGKSSKTTPGMLQTLFKKRDLVDFIFNQAGLQMDQDTLNNMAIFKTPLSIVQKFAPSGADGLVASYRNSEWLFAPGGMHALFALRVAGHRRDGAGPKAQAMIDVVWPVWNGAWDEVIEDLATQGAQEEEGHADSLWWHTWLNETSEQVGAAYRAFVAAFNSGPIRDEGDMIRFYEVGQAQEDELRNLRGLPEQLRRRTVRFAALSDVGGASGAEFSQAQLQSAWEKISFGHRFKFGNKEDRTRRAIVASAELFPPNVAKQGAKARLSDPMACDDKKWERLLEFLISKRAKGDILILFDGRGSANRRVIEAQGQKLAASGARSLVECWCTYSQPRVKEDPRGAVSAWHSNNREMAFFFSLPANSRGENSSAGTAYTGISVRRLSELPRMSSDTKASILGAASGAAVPEIKKMARLQEDIQEKGHPFSLNEVKPISFWQSIMEHHKVTHVVDFTPGSGALAVAAASGAVEYEGIAANEAHRDWLDSILDLGVMHKAGRQTGYAQQLGGDAELA